MINSSEQISKKMTRFGDLIGGQETVVTPITTPQPVVEKPVKEEPKGYSKQELLKLSKIELEELGREYGIELDRRISHAKLVVQLKSFIDSK